MATPYFQQLLDLLATERIADETALRQLTAGKVRRKDELPVSPGILSPYVTPNRRAEIT